MLILFWGHKDRSDRINRLKRFHSISLRIVQMQRYSLLAFTESSNTRYLAISDVHVYSYLMEEIQFDCKNRLVDN